MKKLAKMLCAALLALTLVACGGDKKVEVTTLEIQWVPTNVETADGSSKALEEHLEGLLGMDVNVTVATSYNALIEAMKSKKVHVGIMPPATYALSRESGAAKALLSSTLTDYDQTTEQILPGTVVTTFKAEIVVRADSGIKSYKDLEGKKVAYLGEASASGYVYPVAEMIDAGVDLTKVEFINITDVASSMAAVANKQVDACFVFEGARYVFQNAVKDTNGNPVDVWNELSVFLSTGDIPNDVIAVIPALDEELSAKVEKAFLDMAATDEGLAIMKTWNHNGYLKATESQYDDVAKVFAKAADAR